MKDKYNFNFDLLADKDISRYDVYDYLEDRANKKFIIVYEDSTTVNESGKIVLEFLKAVGIRRSYYDKESDIIYLTDREKSKYILHVCKK